MAHDVICLGEALVDFLPDAPGKRVREVRAWTPCSGGAPANVAVGVARLGGVSALVGVTGLDEFGEFLKESLGAEGVDVRHLRQTAEGKTGLGFVSLTHEGERSFTFYRTQAAETFLGPQDTSGAQAALAAARVLHVGTNSLLKAEARAAVLGAVRQRFEAGLLTSTDPNLRLHLWQQPSILRALLDELLPQCAVVKLSEEEIPFVCDTDDADVALKKLEAQGVLLAVVTLGPKGAALRFAGQRLDVPAPTVQVVDTTGAGDGFMAGLLCELTRACGTRDELARLDPQAVRAAAALACRVGARVVTKLGAVAGLPRRDELER